MARPLEHPLPDEARRALADLRAALFAEPQLVPWWDRDRLPRATGTNCLWHPNEEAIDVRGNVPRCEPCFARFRDDRFARRYRRDARPARPQDHIALSMAQLPGARTFRAATLGLGLGVTIHHRHKEAR